MRFLGTESGSGITLGESKDTISNKGVTAQRRDPFSIWLLLGDYSPSSRGEKSTISFKIRVMLIMVNDQRGKMSVVGRA